MKKRNVSPSGQIELLKREGIFKIREILNPTEEAKIYAVSQLGYLIKEFEQPSEAVQMAAITKPENIMCIKNPTEKVQLEVVNNKPHLISLIKNPTEKVIYTAIKNDVLIFKGESMDSINRPEYKNKYPELFL